MHPLLVLGVLLVFALVGITVYLVRTYNTLIRMTNDAGKAWANIDVILKQRHDELPKLVDVCNTYMAYERDTFEALAKARTAYRNSVDSDDKTTAENMISGALGKLFAVAENYPELKTNQEFQHIQERISTIEETIADRREFYNDAVNLYNIRIAQVPDLWVALQMGFASKPLLAVLQGDREDKPLRFAHLSKTALTPSGPA
jgi:LemA protein